MNVFAPLASVGHARAAHVALRFADGQLRYGELLVAIDVAASKFARHGIRAGDRVCLLLPNVAEFPIAYYALMKLGAVAVSINAMSKPDEVRHIVDDSRAVALVTTSDLLASLPPRRDTPTLTRVFTDDGRDDTIAFRSGAADTHGIVDVPGDTPAAILYTSGTTGKSKGAVLSHSNVISNVTATRRLVGMHADDAMLCFLPLFHCFGQNFVMNASLHTGATLYLQRRFVPADVVAAVERERISILFGVPTAYTALLAHPADAFRSVRYFFSAAAILPLDVERAWHAKTSLHIHEGYGLTETSPFASYNHARAWRAGSVGTPIDDVEMRIVDENDRPLGDGEIGEICIRGPNVMLGYFARAEDTARAIVDGWFHSGDIGYRDADGYYFIVDRVKDMINAAGFKVWPREVEEVLFGHPKVREAAVVGIADAYAGEAVKAFVVLKEGEAADVDDILGHCRERLSKYKVPKSVEFVATIPKGATGKILKRELRK